VGAEVSGEHQRQAAGVKPTVGGEWLALLDFHNIQMPAS